MNDEGFGNMKQILEEVKWDFIESESSVDQQMECFQNLLYKIFDISFPVKSKTIFNETEPFFTEKLIKLKRLKCREFNKHRMSAKYQSFNNTRISFALTRKIILVKILKENGLWK